MSRARGRAADALVIDPGDGHGRSALAGVRALAAAGRTVIVGAYGPVALAGASRAAAATLRLPAPDEPGFDAAVAAAAADAGAVAVFPSADEALVALRSPGYELVDKTTLASRAVAAGIPTPSTMIVGSGEELADRAPELSFPVVVKPALKAFPAKRYADPASLAALAGIDARLIVQPALDGPIYAVGGVVREGRLVAAVHQRSLRTWPSPCGTASAAVTIDPDDDIEAALMRLLDGFEGVFQAQFVGEQLVDLNPRLYGSLPLAVAAGANLPAVWTDLLAGRDVRSHRARPGVRYRWLEGDLRHVVGATRARTMSAADAIRALLPHRATAHSVESIVDPRPMFTRLRMARRRATRSPGAVSSSPPARSRR